MHPALARLGIAIAVSGIFAGSAFALPGAVRTEHPRLYATNEDLKALIAKVPLLNPHLPGDPGATKVAFPGKRGRLSFKFQPSKLTDASGAEASVFGRSDEADGIFLRYRPTTDTRNALLQLGVKAQSKLYAPENFTVPLDIDTELEVEWDADAGTVIFRSGGKELAKRTIPATFDISAQPFVFGGRRGDKMPEFILRDGDDKIVRSFVTDPTNLAVDNGVNLEMFGAWQGLLATASEKANEFITCTKNNDVQGCKLVDGGRFEIIERAKWLVLAYKLTGEKIYLDGARSHLKLIYTLNGGVRVTDPATKKTVTSNAGTGGEWSMSARVGAMGIYYDWLYDVLDPAEKAELKAALLKTLAFDNAGPDDLRFTICGPKELSGLACAANWTDPDGPIYIARQYLGGHAPAAQFNTVLGLLAIQSEDNSVDSLIDTIYRHFDEGVLAGRAAVSQAEFSDEALRAKPWLKDALSGGFQTLFAYNATTVGELPERMRVWQRALNLEPGYVQTKAPWLSAAISPYIYGLRGDGNFPARSDNFTYDLGDFDTGPMALAAAQAGDTYGYGFYREKVIGKRPLVNRRTLWEQLLFDVPTTTPAASPAALPLSALYAVSGNVLVRNTWDYANAALLDFKSTSFISINHHHLDQNSFSLFYKAPLLIDSGQYDSYGSVHWLNYYQRTIAHNSIVLFDPTEKFAFKPTEIWANDGGQWYDNRNPSPTIEEITGSHKLDGITAFEEGEWYAYTEGDGTKAYPGTKLSADAGFVRSIVYLRPEGRPNDTAAKATVVVFDKVRTGAKALAATSLLHMVEQPGANSTPAGSAGRYLYPVASDKTVFTVRNGGGMATIQALLPKNGKAMLVGGQDYGTNTCKQVVRDPNGVEVVKAPSGDCRYLTYKTVANVADWYNYAPATTDNVTADNGKWRLEFSPATTPAAGAAQYFLNVIRVADTDQGTGEAALAPEQKAVLVDTGFETVGVQIGSDRRIIFNGAKGKSMWPIWQPGTFKGTTLVVGVLPNQCYGLTDEQGMKALKPGVGCDYKSSAGGVITIR